MGAYWLDGRSAGLPALDAVIRGAGLQLPDVGRVAEPGSRLGRIPGRVGRGGASHRVAADLELRQ